ncbi:type VI secretion system baseplate subunit TssF [Sinomicrobium soli]|uniref:type VI secretion system baseplate subunit TssF n=1 Tax=Sinomicrobium sp. N-1-3-6 TaxID=2219864 RepID=UPI000DCD8069|nr:type VI secretion system baseplate subunit TssF [Sinomicrobium sp. N-1-3-6]RAV29773.1 hypothetical protein DN748_06565 [Sinomicrobium sp. N-1-3-6]
MKQLSKDQIKDRLLKRAARQWGYSDVELENIFDPIVNLLFDVCAKELENISHEIFSSRRRITERLVDILTPITSSRAMPARAVMQVFPVEDEMTLNDHHQFFFQKRQHNPYNPGEKLIKEFFFGPTKPVKVARNLLKYVVLPNGIQDASQGQFREFLGEDAFLNPLPHGTMWLGVKHKGNGILKNLMFYFYLKNSYQRDTFFHFLPRARWYFNTHKLTVAQGYNTRGTITGGERHMVHEDFHHLRRVEDHVNDYYEKNFVTVKDVINIGNSENSVPEEFGTFVPEDVLAALEEEQLLWFRIEFPNVIGKEILSEIFCATNCFPVINKKLNETQGNIKKLLNIYPLNIGDDFFLELYSVLDDRSRQFDVIAKNQQEFTEDFAYLRFGGVARFDERNATEMINYMVDLVRDEAAAFSRLEADFMEANLHEINQIISRFRNKMAQTGMHRKNIPYLVLNTREESNGTLFVKYWTTNGEEANKINTFSKLQAHRGADFEKDSIVFLSTTRGGRDELTNSDKIYAYRENIISNQRVVTRQDIIILCRNHYGDAVTGIDIKNGIQTSLEDRIGYTPTIDILLEKNEKVNYSEEEWGFLSDDLKLLLRNRAVNIVPFRVMYR